jgi:hypothetical protein
MLTPVFVDGSSKTNKALTQKRRKKHDINHIPQHIPCFDNK